MKILNGIGLNGDQNCTQRRSAMIEFLVFTMIHFGAPFGFTPVEP